MRHMWERTTGGRDSPSKIRKIDSTAAATAGFGVLR